MRITEAKTFLASVVKYNLEQFERGKDHKTFIVPFYVGDPGLGKTAIPNQVAAEAGLPYFQTIVAQFDAGELAGMPMIGDKITMHETADGQVIEQVEKQMIRLRPDYLPDIHDPEQQVGIYNLDELPQAFLANQNICSQLVNQWRIGKHLVSPGITICCTGNKPENKAGTTAMPAHLKDRLLFLEVESNIEDSLNYFNQVGVDYRIRAFLKNNPGYLHKFTPGTNSNPTPRSWEKTSVIINLGNNPTIRTQAVIGQLGTDAGVFFENWIRVEHKMPVLEDVINNPEDPTKAPVFGERDPDVAYILLAALADAANKDNIMNILKYIKRLPNQEFATFWAQDTFRRDPALLNIREVTKWKMTDGVKIMI